MKTTTTLSHNLLRIFGLTICMIMLNATNAQNGLYGPMDFNEKSADNDKVTTLDAPAKAEAAATSEVEQMISNPDYWIDYLNSTVSTEEDSQLLAESTSTIDEMLNTPNYWQNEVEANIQHEDSSEVQKMMTDRYYWPHFISEQIAEQD